MAPLADAQQQLRLVRRRDPEHTSRTPPPTRPNPPTSAANTPRVRATPRAPTAGTLTASSNATASQPETRSRGQRPTASRPPRVPSHTNEPALQPHERDQPLDAPPRRRFNSAPTAAALHSPAHALRRVQQRFRRSDSLPVHTVNKDGTPIPTALLRCWRGHRSIRAGVGCADRRSTSQKPIDLRTLDGRLRRIG